MNVARHKNVDTDFMIHLFSGTFNWQNPPKCFPKLNLKCVLLPKTNHRPESGGPGVLHTVLLQIKTYSKF